MDPEPEAPAVPLGLKYCQLARTGVELERWRVEQLTLNAIAYGQYKREQEANVGQHEMLLCVEISSVLFWQRLGWNAIAVLAAACASFVCGVVFCSSSLQGWHTGDTSLHLACAFRPSSALVRLHAMLGTVAGMRAVKVMQCTSLLSYMHTHT
jgi:hypothetical protein